MKVRHKISGHSARAWGQGEPVGSAILTAPTNKRAGK